MCSGEMTEASAVYFFQNNLFYQAKNAEFTSVANTVCERRRWGLPSVAAMLP